MPMPNQKLYFIAILPPESIIAEVTAFKEDMRLNYGSAKALKVIPHITLKAPFKITPAGSKDVMSWFKNIPIDTKPFTVEMKNFGCFNNPHNKVIYVQPLITEPLAALQIEILKSFKETYPQLNLSTHEYTFKPHMTIAYRDLTEENYEKAWAVYKDKTYQSKFTCNSFFLLQHNGLNWEVVQEHSLKI